MSPNYDSNLATRMRPRLRAMRIVGLLRPTIWANFLSFFFFSFFPLFSLHLRINEWMSTRLRELELDSRGRSEEFRSELARAAAADSVGQLRERQASVGGGGGGIRHLADRWRLECTSSGSRKATFSLWNADARLLLLLLLLHLLPSIGVECAPRFLCVVCFRDLLQRARCTFCQTNGQSR